MINYGHWHWIYMDLYGSIDSQWLPQLRAEKPSTSHFKDRPPAHFFSSENVSDKAVAVRVFSGGSVISL